MNAIENANRLIKTVTDAELAALAVIAINRNDENTAELLASYEREASRRGFAL